MHLAVSMPNPLVTHLVPLVTHPVQKLHVCEEASLAWVPKTKEDRHRSLPTPMAQSRQHQLTSTAAFPEFETSRTCTASTTNFRACWLCCGASPPRQNIAGAHDLIFSRQQRQLGESHFKPSQRPRLIQVASGTAPSLLSSQKINLAIAPAQNLHCLL
jgi:hypothetical protein